MLNQKTFLLLLALFSIAGCMNTKIDYAEKLAAVPVCCAELSGISYVPLEYDKPVTRLIGDKKSLARTFKEGKSYFVAFALPEFDSPYELQLASSPRGGGLFPPKVQLLDQNFRLRKNLLPEQFNYSNGVLSNNFFVNTDQGYRYALIYTNPKKLGAKKNTRMASRSTTGVVSGPYLMNIYSGHDDTSEIEVAAGGQITVTLKKYAPRKLK